MSTNMLPKTVMAVAVLTILTPLARANDYNQVGRYQLVAADVDHSGKQTVFKIDTVTGQAWTYSEVELLDMSKVSDGVKHEAVYRYWDSINEQDPPRGKPVRTIVGR
jgi:hypothetical protein